MSVSISKTAVMIFNKTGRQLQESHRFKCESFRVPFARAYCFFEIVFNLAGSNTTATEKFKKIGLKAYFALKNLLHLDALSIKSVF